MRRIPLTRIWVFRVDGDQLIQIKAAQARAPESMPLRPPRMREESETIGLTGQVRERAIGLWSRPPHSWRRRRKTETEKPPSTRATARTRFDVAAAPLERATKSQGVSYGDSHQIMTIDSMTRRLGEIRHSDSWPYALEVPSDRQLARPSRPVRSDGVVTALGCVLARTAEPVWQSWTCCSGVQCRSSAGQRLANKRPTLTCRNAQLRGSCDWLGGRRMGVVLAARKSG